MRIEADEALLLQDVQVDFCPGGALAVPDGDAVVPSLNRWIEAFEAARRPIFASRDWHPPDHCSFRDRGGTWPPHCVAGSAGAAFHPSLRLPPNVHVVSKATTRNAEAYSTFDGTDFDERLRRLGVRRLVIGGLATDYCVRATVLDARRLGFAVGVPRDAIRAVDVHPGDGDRAIAEMRAAGATILEASDRS
ncbi:MAG: isochorismatase family protein [Planctomycetes bacterium]|nr:isochorismatase family protein [Planctomycetota bacterium]MBI3848458.1 isochorismatase family protein [Planctomycetota bacterium]